MQTLQQTDTDFVLNGRVRLAHPATGGFRTAIDAVFLGAACPAKAGDHVGDLGCGVGAAGLCVLARVTGVHLTGVEIQAPLVELAVDNAATSGLGDRAAFVTGDIRDYVPDALFDHVICNPPYLAAGTYTPSPDASRGLALGHHGQDTVLDDWIRAAHRLVKSRGTFTIVHRADHLDQIIVAAGRKFGALEIFPLWPRVGDDAKRVVVRMIKDRRDPPRLHPGIVLHEKNGDWTAAADAVLRDMKVLGAE